jgi:hypothetical protein
MYDEFGRHTLACRGEHARFDESLKVLQVGNVKASFELGESEPTMLRVFIDRAMVE